MKENIICPLGSKCFEIKDNTPIRCAWHIKLCGYDAQGKEHDEWGCAICWLPTLQLEIASTNRGQTSAIESMRNEQIKRMDIALMQGLSNAKDIVVK
jgi:hypothetical protein